MLCFMHSINTMMFSREDDILTQSDTIFTGMYNELARAIQAIKQRADCAL